MILQKRHILCFVLCLISFHNPHLISAREPTARVIEIAINDEIPPPPCSPVRLHDHTLFISTDLYKNFPENLPPTVFHDLRLQWMEDTRTIVLLRNPESCRIGFLLEKLLPLDQLRMQTRFSLPDDYDLIELKDSYLVLKGKTERRIPMGSGQCLDPLQKPDNPCSVFIYDYGYLPIVVGKPAISRNHASIGDVVDLHFFGPGDVREYLITVPQAGMIIVETHDPVKPGRMDIRMFDSTGNLIGQGGASLRAPGILTTRFTYRGTGPGDITAGFLFNPDLPLRCSLSIQPESSGHTTIRVTLINEGDTPVETVLLDAGAVRLYSDDRLIAGAVPGRPPQRIIMQPGERQVRTFTVEETFNLNRIHAEILGSNSSALFLCFPGEGR